MCWIGKEPHIKTHWLGQFMKIKGEKRELLGLFLKVCAIMYKSVHEHVYICVLFFNEPETKHLRPWSVKERSEFLKLSWLHNWYFERIQYFKILDTRYFRVHSQPGSKPNRIKEIRKWVREKIQTHDRLHENQEIGEI